MKATKIITALTISLLFVAEATSYACMVCGCSAPKKAEVKKQCPPDCNKPCCAEKKAKKSCVKESKACPADCKKPCCAEKKAEEPTWLTDFKAATAIAKEKKLPILVDFSGSDWCGWCIKLEKEVFSKKEFKEYAAKNLVLVLADFPQAKKQTDEVKKQNQALQAKYKNEIEGYPTVLLLDADGKVIAKTGYQPGGPEKYVKHLKKLLKK